MAVFLVVIIVVAALVALAAVLVYGTSVYVRLSVSKTGARSLFQLRLLFGLIKLPLGDLRKKRKKKTDRSKRHYANMLLDIPRIKDVRLTARIGLEDAAKTVLLAGAAQCAAKVLFAPFMARKGRMRLWVKPLFNQKEIWFDLEGIIVLDVSQIMPIKNRGRI